MHRVAKRLDDANAMNASHDEGVEDHDGKRAELALAIIFTGRLST